ncbi:hypothetical protein ACIDI_96c00040 [Acidiphilium sp. JA12-A1]|nr:hypothetical protein ACIDI_96c00040 [Acidiphilium sp. JA12-A1]
MFHRIRDISNRAGLNRVLRRILDTRPIAASGKELLIFSAVSHHDLLMYLAAVKSLARFLPAPGVVALNDGSLTAADIAVLQHHLPGIRIVLGPDVNTGRVPADLMWQRLFWSVRLAEDAYVIQLDADTLALARPSALLDAIAGGKSFILGTSECRSIEPIPTRTAAVLDNPSRHIQVTAERAMINLPDAQAKRYIRGSAGLYGLAPDHVHHADPENLFVAMNKLTNGRFIEYGSEQFAANYLVANAPRSVALPFPTYAVHDIRDDLTGAIFLHFIGSYRFHNGAYARAARAVIADLA